MSELGMANGDIYEVAGGFFNGLKEARLKNRISDHLRASDRALQFEPADGEPFYVDVQGGVVSIGKGKKYPLDLQGGLYVRGDSAALRDLFAGEMSLAESIYHHKIRIPGYRNREPVMVWFSKLLRLGLGIKD